MPKLSIQASNIMIIFCFIGLGIIAMIDLVPDDEPTSTDVAIQILDKNLEDVEGQLQAQREEFKKFQQYFEVAANLESSTETARESARRSLQKVNEELEVIDKILGESRPK